jgi:hypothetical protein
MMSGQARSSAVIMGLRHSHDLGSRACSLPLHQNAHHNINRSSHHYAGALLLTLVNGVLAGVGGVYVSTRSVLITIIAVLVAMALIVAVLVFDG